MGYYGIDMGTSYIKVSKIKKDGKVQSVNMSGGIMSVLGSEKQILSALYLQKNGEFLVGAAAYNVCKQDPSRYVSQFKRKLGQGAYLLGGTPYTAQELYTEVFRFILKEADRQGDPVEQAVLTVPAVYTEQQKQLVQEAAARAGLAEIELLEEPVAAASCYASTQTIAEGEKILVYDLGGGTFDTALIERTKDGYRLLSEPRGLPACGGALFDDLIFCDLQQKVAEIAPNALQYNAFRIELAQTATKIKHLLSVVESYDESIMVGFDMLSYHIERNWFEEQVRPELEQTLVLCDQVIADAGLKPMEIQHILPVGGASTMPIVARMLTEHYPYSLLCRTEEPGLLVSYGAALCADPSLERRAQRGDAQAQYELAEILIESNDEEDKRKAVEWYRKAAEQGIAVAQFNLAVCYDDGEGTAVNKPEAFHWYKAAAEQGFAKAQFNLAGCYDKGEGTVVNKSEAFHWYKAAAEQGIADAQFNLAVCYDNGKGTEVNKTEAFRWCKAAAEQGIAIAQYNLAVCYSNGIGTAVDKPEAVRWYKAAAEQGIAVAQYNLAVCYDNGKGTEVNKTEAFRWCKAAAEQGIAIAQYNLAVYYANGKGTEVNKTQAFHWYKAAAEQGIAVAQYNLAVCYDIGEGTEINKPEAFRWYKAAAEQGLAVAQYNLAVYYANGKGTEVNKTQAFHWYKAAAEQGYANAQNNLGVCYSNGIGTAVNKPEAVRWYKAAAKQGAANAQYNLAVCYDNGEGIEVNKTEAFRWYKAAAEQGDADAQKRLRAIGSHPSKKGFLELLFG